MKGKENNGERTRTSGSLTRRPFLTIGVTERNCNKGLIKRDAAQCGLGWWDDVHLRRGQRYQRRLPRFQELASRPFRTVPNERVKK